MANDNEDFKIVVVAQTEAGRREFSALLKRIGGCLAAYSTLVDVFCSVPDNASELETLRIVGDPLERCVLTMMQLYPDGAGQFDVDIKSLLAVDKHAGTMEKFAAELKAIMDKDKD